jgi:hypothetical protein
MNRDERIAYWSEQNRLWKLSGKSQKNFCLEHGLCLRKFVYWRCDVINKRKTNISQSKLYKVLTASQPPKACESDRLEVFLPGGIKIHINSDTDIIKACRFIKLLGCTR